MHHAHTAIEMLGSHFIHTAKIMSRKLTSRQPETGEERREGT